MNNKYSIKEFNKAIASGEIKIIENNGMQIVSGLQFPFPKKTIDFYRNSDFIFISDDGMSFSFRFGTRMPKQ